MPITGTTAHAIANNDNGISNGNDVAPDQFAGISTHFSTITPVDEDDRLKLLPFEQNLMVDSFISDILFIMARLVFAIETGNSKNQTHKMNII
jgi:hypothetical protein